MKVTIELTDDEANAVAYGLVGAGYKTAEAKLQRAVKEVEDWYRAIKPGFIVNVAGKGSGQYLILARHGNKLWIMGRFADMQCPTETGLIIDVKQVMNIINFE